MPENSPNQESSLREKLLEHAFLTELMRCLWRQGVRDIDVLKAEVDRGGYDVMVMCKGIQRFIQLKANSRTGKASRQTVNLNLAAKPGGCVVWLVFDPDDLSFASFRWFGGEPGSPLPTLGTRIAKHGKRNADGLRAERPNLRVLTKREFTTVKTIGELAVRLFG